MKNLINRHEIARTLEPRQRTMFHQLGATVQNIKTVKLGFQYDADEAHQHALWALDATKWQSLKAAKALLHISRII